MKIYSTCDPVYNGLKIKGRSLTGLIPQAQPRELSQSMTSLRSSISITQAWSHVEYRCSNLPFSLWYDRDAHVTVGFIQKQVYSLYIKCNRVCFFLNELFGLAGVNKWHVHWMIHQIKQPPLSFLSYNPIVLTSRPCNCKYYEISIYHYPEQGVKEKGCQSICIYIHVYIIIYRFHCLLHVVLSSIPIKHP